MIPKKHSFWHSEKQATIIVILEYLFSGKEVKTLSFADFKTLTVGYISIEHFSAAVSEGRMKEISQ